MTVSADARSGAVWQLFTDWCTALGHRALPAGPAVLAQFIAANPAAQGTQRRRVGVVNAVHRRCGHPEPGRAETVRQLIDARRGAKAQMRGTAAAEAISRLPETGWPTALFARRDAILLALSAAAVPLRAIAELRAGDVQADMLSDSLVITVNGETFRTPASLAQGDVSPRKVLAQWLRVRAIQHHRPSPRWLAAYLRGEPVPAVGAVPDDLALLTPIDRWGATPWLPTPLRPASVSHIVNSHLNGWARPHPAITGTPERDPISPALPEPPVPAALLDPASFTRGVAARRRAAGALDGVTDVLDDVESRADRILEDLLRLLDEPVPPLRAEV
ncbi:recombinase [[Mycobacterium] burgundiense]|uniref:Recombinase n=1 Tax=[Mycobacterium] burgundiense TaxID=3064286 RepID=A0ABM9LVG1_9MYCO|nr:recombinase [Mycolicibacterium sp. MU0053]CAJ1505391.1 recombinase [Mycolicibacterium sp. MU0053]